MAASGAGVALSARRLAQEADERKAPLMGVLGAFVFAAQMINFAIPGTGSSGHLGGGMLLAMLLGPYAAFITIASVLIVQALLFADGGILALGANIFNLGFFPCFIGFFIFKLVAGKNFSMPRLSVSAIIGTVVALELGALSVVLQTVLSAKSDLRFAQFALLMTGIHLPIALIEGVVTIAVMNFVYRVRPEVVRARLGMSGEYGARVSFKPIVIGALIAALLTGGALVWFASSHPDGLEWALRRATGGAEIAEPHNPVAQQFEKIQEKTAIMPDYKTRGDNSRLGESGEASLSGILGSIVVLCIAGFAGFLLLKLRGKKKG